MSYFTNIYTYKQLMESGGQTISNGNRIVIVLPNNIKHPFYKRVLGHLYIEDKSLSDFDKHDWYYVDMRYE